MNWYGFKSTQRAVTHFLLVVDADALSVKTNLMYCKSRIGMLESQLTNTETELKEQTILHEREISELKRLHDVRSYSDVWHSLNQLLFEV